MEITPGIDPIRSYTYEDQNSDDELYEATVGFFFVSNGRSVAGDIVGDAVMLRTDCIR